MLVSLLKLWGWHACAQQTEEKPLPHNFSSFMSSLCRLPVQHLWSVFCNMICYGPTSETGWVLKRQKNWSKYT